MKKIFVGILSLSLIILTGCSSSEKRISNPMSSGPFHSKNYILNQSRTISVGEQLLKVEGASDATYVEIPTFISRDDIKITALAGNEITTIARNQKLKSPFSLKIDDKVYYMLPIQNKANSSKYKLAYLFLDKDSLTLETKVRDMFDLPARISNNVPFIKGENEKEYSTLYGEVNYDIVYNGISGDTIRLTYREFTSNDLARPAFFQDITYNKNTKIIKFKKIEIQILKLTNNELTYKVIKDGM
ncbi:hypothetical protein [Candidatus Cetobacterium colombiensis]|uniref:Uncharacterized protein n=1 Tax=Candidatus Cetobacterium colombiensis TaxID=3073100 RepID=A0ABU4WF83_9FUSO|nr:hypothetical protein [Candidatus Cetobacterium colombiensis]MDX8337359.1 hypothetical protein [Candidatus Cetobacterium colombiensis]